MWTWNSASTGLTCWECCRTKRVAIFRLRKHKYSKDYLPTCACNMFRLPMQLRRERRVHSPAATSPGEDSPKSKVQSHSLVQLDFGLWTLDIGLDHEIDLPWHRHIHRRPFHRL